MTLRIRYTGLWKNRLLSAFYISYFLWLYRPKAVQRKRLLIDLPLIIAVDTRDKRGHGLFQIVRQQPSRGGC